MTRRLAKYMSGWKASFKQRVISKYRTVWSYHKLSWIKMDTFVWWKVAKKVWPKLGCHRVRMTLETYFWTNFWCLRLCAWLWSQSASRPVCQPLSHMCASWSGRIKARHFIVKRTLKSCRSTWFAAIHVKRAGTELAQKLASSQSAYSPWQRKKNLLLLGHPGWSLQTSQNSCEITSYELWRATVVASWMAPLSRNLLFMTLHFSWKLPVNSVLMITFFFLLNYLVFLTASK